MTRKVQPWPPGQEIATTLTVAQVAARVARDVWHALKLRAPEPPPYKDQQVRRWIRQGRLPATGGGRQRVAVLIHERPYREFVAEWARTGRVPEPWVVAERLAAKAAKAGRKR